MQRFLEFLRQILAHASLVEVLVRRDLKIRYQALGLGYVWSLLNPLLMLAVYTFVFSVVLGSPIADFPVYLACGLLPYIWFNSALATGTMAIVSSGPLLRRRPVPAQILPLVPVASQGVQFLTSLPILFAFLWVFGRELSVAVVLLPLIIALQFALTYGIALVLATVSVRFRDVQHLLANLLLVLFFMAPIVYPWEFVPDAVKPLLLLNPVTLLAHSYQNILFFGRWPFWNEVWLLAAMGLAALGLGFAVMSARAESFAEQV